MSYKRVAVAMHIRENISQILLLLVHRLGKGEYIFPGVSQGEGGLSVEQLGAIVLFQPLDVVAERLLGYIEPLSRFRHIQIFGQLLKVIQTDYTQRCHVVLTRLHQNRRPASPTTISCGSATTPT